MYTAIFFEIRFGKGFAMVVHFKRRQLTVAVKKFPLSLHFAIQIVMPFRYVLYPGKLFWTEQGFRFSWRVMLMEKGGYAIFHVRDPESGREGEVDNAAYLSPNQEKMMSTQPDMILQFAHPLIRKMNSGWYLIR